jgi:hypothetical protein
MSELIFILVGEGASDEALVWVIRWLLRQLLPGVRVEGGCANLGDLPSARDLAGRVIHAISEEPCDVLFVHRDADTAGRSPRVEEIGRAVHEARRRQGILIPIVPVVPVRMRETWLLTDEGAIRRAAGNPNGRMPLNLPRVRDLERLADPKTALNTLILTASGLRAHRRQRFEVDTVAVAEETGSFEALRQLPAFQAFESDLRRVIAEQGWPEHLG